MLRQCDDVDSFLSASDDRFVSCFDFIAWRRSPNLFGLDVWGDGSATNLRRRAGVLDHFTALGSHGQRLLFDSSGCSDGSPMMYKAAAEYWSSRRKRHAEALNKVAVIVSHGHVGALVTGLIVLMNLGFSVRTFQNVESALVWLGEADASSLAVELRGLRASARKDDGVLERLQRLLAAQGLSLDVTDAARRLGMSPRTLQRRLSTIGTTFQTEVLHARLAKSTTLMLTGRHSMTAIAFDLGFSSPQHFSSSFSAIYGVPPSTWLRNYRAVEGGR